MSRKTDVLSGSHLPILIELLRATKGPVLEIGMGLNSTPVLHWICTHQKRRLLSLENDPSWIEPNKAYENEYHKVEFVEDWNKAPIDDTYWSVVLIDHRPAIRRREEAKRLKDNADFILIHDSEPEINKFYRYDTIYPLFDFKYNITKLKPNTVILSNSKKCFSKLKNIEL